MIRACPECVAGKHYNCPGDAWDDEEDKLVDCPCYARGHRASDPGGQAFELEPPVDLQVLLDDIARHRREREHAEALEFDPRELEPTVDLQEYLDKLMARRRECDHAEALEFDPRELE